MANATVPVVLLSAAVLSVVAPPVVWIAAMAASNCALLTASVLLTAVATLLTVLLPALIRTLFSSSCYTPAHGV